ncbi:MAG: hypothetical protein HC913_12380 [Microscillaceae bacterium]|nr:hypothetical protein [Microscillaceae bacterium]
MSELNLSNAVFFVPLPSVVEKPTSFGPEKKALPVPAPSLDQVRLAEANFQQRKMLDLMVRGSFLMMHFAVLVQALQKQGEQE